MPAGHQSVRAGDEADGSSGVASGEAGQANPFTVLLNELYPDFYTGWFSAVSDGSAASTPDKEADNGSLLRGSSASGGDSHGSGVLTSADSGLTSVAGNASTSTGSPADTSTPKTGVDLNLTSQEATNDFDYKKDGNYVTYTAKGDNAFKLVKDGTTKVWEATADASEYANKIVSVKRESGIIDVTIYMDNGNKKLFIKETENDPWNEIDITKVHPKLVNIDYPYETHFYKNELKDKTRTFEAQEGFTFNVVNEGSGSNKVEIWKTTNENEYAKKVVSEGGNKVTIHLSDGSTKVFNKGSDNTWALDTSSTQTGQSGSGAPSGQSSETQSSSSAADGSTSTSASPTSGGTNQSSGVTSGSTQDSKTGSEQSSSTSASGTGSQQPSGQPSSGKGPAGSQSQSSSSATQPKESPASQSQSKDSPTSQSQSQTGKSQSSSSTSPSSTSGPSGKRDTSGQSARNQGASGSHTESSSSSTKVSFIAPVDINIMGDFKSTDDYDYEQNGNFATYTVKGENAFKSVKENKVEIWKAIKLRHYATKVEVDSLANEGKAFTVYLRDDTSKVFIKENAEDTFKEIDVTKVNPKSMDITDDKETYVYSNMLQGSTRTFTAKNGFAFNIVKDSNTDIWTTTDESECANEIVLVKRESGIIDLTIYLVNGGDKLFIKETDKDPWKEIDLTKVNPESVDINYEHETHFYKNELDNNVRTFTAKKAFTFNSAHEYVDNNKVEIWKTDQESHYANKIEEYHINEDAKAVILYIDDEKTKVFKKDGKNEAWKEIDLTKVNPESVDINYEHDTHSFQNELKGTFRTFTIRSGFAFKCANEYIDGNKVEIWKTDNESEYVNKIEVDSLANDGKAVTIHLDGDKSKLFKKDSKNEPWTEIDLSKVNLMFVNINHQYDTYFYSNKLDKNVRTFEPKTGFALNIVNEGSGNNKVEIWKSGNQNEYAKKVVSAERESGIIDVTIYMDNGNKKLFIKETENDPWNEIDITKVHPKLVNIDYPYETHFYNNELEGSTRTFTAKNNFPFNVVNEGSGSNKVEIWKAEDESKYANKVVNEGYKTLTIYIGDSTSGSTKLFMRDNINNPWTEIDTTIVNPRSVNITDTKETYFYSNKLDKNNVRTFEAKNRFAFNVVNEIIDDKKVEIWKTDNESDYVNKVVSEKLISGTVVVTFYLVNGGEKLFIKEGGMKDWKEIDISKLNPEPVNINYPYETHFCKNILHDYVRTLTAKKGFIFNNARCLVKNNWVDIWKADNENEYVNKIEYVGDLKVIIYTGNDGTARVFEKGPNGKWPGDDSEPESSSSAADGSQGGGGPPKGGSQGGGGPPKGGPQGGGSQGGGGPPKGGPQGGGGPPKGGPQGTGETKPSTPKTGVDLNLTSQEATNDFDYKKDGNYVTYTAKGDNAFKLVKDGTTKVWEATADEYSSKIEVDLMNNNARAVTIYFDDDKTMVLKNDVENDLWIAIDTTKVNPCSLNINYSSETYLYKNEHKNNVRTFTTRSGFAFKCANEYIDGNKVEIWKTDNESEYVNKIEVDLMNNDSKAVTVFQGDDKTRLFIKENANDTWKEIDVTKVNPKSMDITDDKETYVYSNMLQGSTRTFTAKNGFAFNFVNEIIDDKKVEIWKTDNESEYVNKIEVNPINNDAKAVTIYFAEDKTKLFKKDGKNEPWAEIDTTIVNPRSVNITDTKETYFYSNKLDKNNVRTFEAKNRFAFNVVNESINNNIVEVWKTDNESEYVNKIEVDLMDNESKALTIYFAEDKTKLFTKDDKNDPLAEIDTTIVNAKPINIKYERESYSCTNTLDNGFRTFEPKTGFTFKSAHEYVDGNKVEIWKAEDESKYTNKIVSVKRHSGILDLTIHLVNEKKVLFVQEKANDPWKEIDLTKVNPESVDINYEHDTHFYKNELKDKTRTFEAQEGFAFNVVNEGSGSNKVEIWKTTNENEYAKKVVSVKRESGIIDVTIHLVKGGEKLFIKETDKDPWKEIDITKVNVKSVDINYEHDTYFYTNKLDKDVRTFTAKKGFSFNVFSDGDTDIWTTSNENEYANKVVSAKRHTGIIDVTIHLVKGGEKLFIKESGKKDWKEIDITKVNAESVDINYEHETHFFKNELNGKIRTFTAKKGFRFKDANEHIDGNKVEIWKAEDESKYVKKIDSVAGKKLIIYMGDDGTAKVFDKGSDGKWPGANVVPITPTKEGSEPQSSSSPTEGVTPSGSSETLEVKAT
ncbi:hypothetical protein MACJ_001661 [Theileria orientalis]|uniref:Uncharacterized protein n=1 Tax=Theileria orientalis TaxID=68886 RepID=A0A976QTX0_THEOR|nr:hypothetical protein MACJ_001661 [Theileria orientalis]